MKRILTRCLVAGALLTSAILSQANAASPANALRDTHGKMVDLAALGEGKVVVLAFLGTECPLAKIYAPRLATLAKGQDASKVVFLGINSNIQDNITKVKHFARSHGIEFPMLMDVDQELADQWEVKRVPEVIVLGTDGKLKYRGRVDDQHGFQVGPEGKRAAYHLPEPRRADLQIALEEILAGKEVSVAATEAPGCLIGRARPAKEDAEVTYSSHIAAIFNKHCVFCHREGQIGPFPMTSHDEVAGWSEMIQEVVQERRMPPWHADPKHGEFKNDARLSEEEIALISQWVADGAPAGDLAKAPPIPKFPEGWMIPEPDEVIYMAKEPYTVQAEGTVPYKNFIVDPGWTEDKWVTAMEPKPGNPKVVHHIVMYVIPPKGKSKYYTKGLPITMLDWFVSFAPGLRPPVLPEHMGRFIPAGSKLLFQMHYTPCGTEEQDLSFVGVKFADPAKVKREVAVQHAGNMLFRIPPHAKDFKLTSTYKFDRDSLLLTVSPHMHWRGKDFKYTLTYPDGKEEVILSVPHYDFGWQTTYILAEPKKIPKGSRLDCVAHYDNSIDNLNNPDPNATVTFGEQTWDEMMYGWFEIALADEELELTAKPKEDPKPAAGESE